ncbi:unnamed protein product [Effrenium voratum]|nr:unnamed protein product [Effrenium voratum]
MATAGEVKAGEVDELETTTAGEPSSAVETPTEKVEAEARLEPAVTEVVVTAGPAENAAGGAQVADGGNSTALPPIRPANHSPTGRQSLVPPKQARADARRRILAARLDLERRVAEATGARLERQKAQEAEARQRAEAAQRRARKRLAERKKSRSPEKALEEARLDLLDKSRSPSRDLPGLRPAKARVKQKIQRQREEQQARLQEIEEDRQRAEQRKREAAQALELHRQQAAKRAAERLRAEKESEARAKAEREQELQEARERQKQYKSPKSIAKLISNDAAPGAHLEERKRAAQREESHLRRERERARRHLDDGAALERPFGTPRLPSKTREEPFEEDEFMAKTVHALTDEDWKVNIKFS